jgi:hypothetical protein
MRLVEVDFNKDCSCNSGKPFGKCCGITVKQWANNSIIQAKFPKPQIFAAQLGEFGVRTFGNKLIPRPKGEHIQEFIVHALRWKLGEAWYKEQETKSLEKRHVIMRWINARFEFLKEMGAFNFSTKDRVRPSGEVMELMSLAADMYYLDLVHALPKDILARLRHYDSFQGARYEIAVAAALVRVGFDIKWIKPHKQRTGQKFCEFNATHKVSKETIAIEAKSRKREGTYHYDGTMPDFSCVKADIFRLYNDALTHNPGDKPFGIFIDINVPHQPKIPTPDKNWVSDLFRKFGEEGESVLGNTPPSFLTITNLGWHYDGKSPATWGDFILTPSSDVPFPLKENLTFEAIFRALNEFGSVPDEAQS